MSATGIADELQIARAGRGRSGLVYGGLAAAAVLIGGLVFALGPWRGGPPAVAGTPTTAVAVFVRGPVFRVDATGTRKTPLRVGNRLKENETIVTDSGAIADLVLSGKQVLRLRGAGLLKLAAMRRHQGVADARLELKSGTLLNLVRRKTKKERYRVTTPTAIASVRGTAFRIVAAAQVSRILVTRGRVAVEARHKPAQGQERVLSPGMQIVVERGRFGSSRPESSAAKSLQKQYDEMQRHASGLDLSLLRKIHKRSQVRTEADLKKRYSKDLELLILGDGRQLRGAVVEQKGVYLIVHTLNGVEVVPMADIVKVKMLK